MTAFVNSWLSQRSQRDERAFREKQSAYVGLLEAYHRAAVEGTDETSKAFAYWQMRCELVAPEPVRDAIRRIVSTNEDRAGRERADADMKRDGRRSKHHALVFDASVKPDKADAGRQHRPLEFSQT
ncbi:hypothetical protein PX554_21405 [Sphingomonas sp. H39-1-10]|uniref:hypothetical protein n=1 Tax=Sphingomonas pollutisoli TaxID=3030829 RepID=UPI0023B99F6A|nr:hypothetical protein [Sphingomonas pollutisoli]MDF0490693.1 hypothetical protein [Sphingomonas pollutisoli]